MLRAAKRKKKAKARLTNALIPPPSVPADDERLVFSFKYLQDQHAKFPLSDCSAAYHAALLLTIKSYNEWPLERFCDVNHDARRHPIDFSETTETAGFGLDEQLDYVESWQFCLSGEQSSSDDWHLWRVNGFLINATFFVVWRDP